MKRAELAVKAANALLPRVVVFSGGRSWRQAAGGIIAPSEGGMMLQHAHNTMGGVAAIEGVDFLCEEESESTVANMVNSVPLLGLKPGDSLGILSDRLHFPNQRPQRIAAKVFPRVDIRNFIIQGPYTPAEAREEQRAALATRIVLAGVQKGNGPAIMRRQRGLERVN